MGTSGITLWDSGYFAYPRTETDLEPEPTHWYTDYVLDWYIDNTLIIDNKWKTTGVMAAYENYDFVLLPLEDTPEYPLEERYQYLEGWFYTVDSNDDKPSRVRHYSFVGVDEYGNVDWHNFIEWEGEANSYMQFDETWWHSINVDVERSDLAYAPLY